MRYALDVLQHNVHTRHNAVNFFFHIFKGNQQAIIDFYLKIKKLADFKGGESERNFHEFIYI